MSTMSDLAQEVQEVSKEVMTHIGKLDPVSQDNLNAMLYRVCSDMVVEDQEALKEHKQHLQKILGRLEHIP